MIKDRAVELLIAAYQMAKDSPDPSNQNGAVIVNHRYSIIATGRNEFPKKVQITPELLADRDTKLFYIEHAERNAIFNGVYNDIEIPGRIMVCPWFACSDCARAIILCGISKVIGHKQRMEQTPERWVKSVNAGIELMKLHGVKIELIDAQLGCDPVIVNGNLWQP